MAFVYDHSGCDNDDMWNIKQQIRIALFNLVFLLNGFLKNVPNQCFII